MPTPNTAPTVQESLLLAMHGAPDFGSAFGLPPDEMSIYLQRMEAVRQDYLGQMGPLVAAGLPDWKEERREVFVSGSERWVVFSPGLAADMTSDEGRLGDMAVLTGLTAVVNGLLDGGDKAMPLAIKRFAFRRFTTTDRGSQYVPPELRPTVRARSSILWGIVHKLGSVGHPRDLRRLVPIMSTDLMRDGARIHELSDKFSQTGAEAENAFLTENATEITRLMIDTGAIQSVTAPLYSMLRRENRALKSLREVHGSEYVTRLLKLANTIIRVQDDFGDMERDATEETFSINLFNQSSPLLLSAFCGQVGLKGAEVERVVSELPSADTKEKAQAVIQIFINHFLEHAKNAPKGYELYTTLVKRALAAGYVNIAGDDALRGQPQPQPGSA